MFRSPLYAALGLVALVSSVSAQPLPTTKIIAGYIVSADATTRTVQVKTGIDTQTYTIAEDAKVEAGKAPLQAADLAGVTGQRVTLWYTSNGDTRLVSRAKVDESKGAAAAKVAAPATTAVTPE
jgi:hypothetical protein